MNFKVILSSILVSGLLASSAQAYLSGSPPRDIYSGAWMSTLSTFAPVIGPLVEEAKIPQDEINNHLYSQAVMVASNQQINDTANFISAMSSFCQMSEKEMAQVVMQMFESNPTAELTCPSPQN